MRENQHGFSTGKYCLTNFLDIFEQVKEDVDKCVRVDNTYLDISKSSDKLLHQRVLSKLSNHGIRGLVLSLIKKNGYMAGSRVGINKLFSQWQEVSSDTMVTAV